ncbi:MAG TPA: hypothetical protein VJ761_01665, partial [Ktedonobacteraceae bacterium]|nr:hypothetical protein [Ktedonobacteraceae bacterium]
MFRTIHWKRFSSLLIAVVLATSILAGIAVAWNISPVHAQYSALLRPALIAAGAKIDGNGAATAEGPSVCPHGGHGMANGAGIDPNGAHTQLSEGTTTDPNGNHVLI